MLKKKQLKDETGSTTIQSAYILLFTIIIFTFILGLGQFYYKKHNLTQNTQLMSLKIANMTINENKNCGNAINETKNKHNNQDVTKIQITKYECQNTWIQIQTTQKIKILQIPVNITSISRAGIKNEN